MGLMGLEAVPAGELPPDVWDECCDASDSAWFWHRRAWIDYTLAYGSDRHRADLSFVLVDRDRPVAPVAVFLEERTHGDATYLALGFGGGSWWAPALIRDLPEEVRAEVLDATLGRMADLARDTGAAYSSLKAGPLSHPWGRLTGELVVAATRHGWSDRSSLTRVVDLSLPLDLLRRAMTKGHRAAVGRAERLFTVRIVDRERPDAELFESYRLTHLAAAGRETRPRRTFDLMHDWILEGSAALLTALDGDTPIGFAFLITYGGQAYYASAANDPGRAGEPIGHALQWAAFRYLQDHGVRSYELGEQLYGPLPHLVPTTKELNISRFKRGFGGRTMVQLERERWWDPELYRQIERSRADEYAGAIQS